MMLKRNQMMTSNRMKICINAIRPIYSMNAVCVMIVFVYVERCMMLQYYIFSIYSASLYSLFFSSSTLSLLLSIQEDFRISVITSLNKLSHHPLEASLLIAVWDARSNIYRYRCHHVNVAMRNNNYLSEARIVSNMRAQPHGRGPSHKRWRAVDRRQRVQYPRACVTTYFKCMNCANERCLEHCEHGVTNEVRKRVRLEIVIKDKDGECASASDACMHTMKTQTECIH